MNWLKKFFREKGRRYQGDGFSVQANHTVREGMRITYASGDEAIQCSGELIGKRWRSIAVRIPQTVEREKAQTMAQQIAEALKDWGYLGYVIDRVAAVEIVPEEERKAALAKLDEMGFEIEVLPNGAVRQRLKSGASRPSREQAANLGLQMFPLVRAAYGKRPRIETLAKSDEL